MLEPYIGRRRREGRSGIARRCSGTLFAVSSAGCESCLCTSMPLSDEARLTGCSDSTKNVRTLGVPLAPSGVRGSTPDEVRRELPQPELVRCWLGVCRLAGCHGLASLCMAYNIHRNFGSGAGVAEGIEQVVDGPRPLGVSLEKAAHNHGQYKTRGASKYHTSSTVSYIRGSKVTFEHSLISPIAATPSSGTATESDDPVFCRDPSVLLHIRSGTNGMRTDFMMRLTVCVPINCECIDGGVRTATATFLAGTLKSN